MELFPQVLSESHWTVFQRTGGDISSAVGIRNKVNGEKLFLKFNFDSTSRPNLFSGEFESLLAMRKTDCGIVVPKPIAFCDNGILMEYIEMSSSKNLNEFDLGLGLAKMHLHNRMCQNPVEKFGFHVDTCCGAISFSNNWTEDWSKFYFNQRLGALVRKIQNCQLNEMFSKLEADMEQFFHGITIVPSLVHGDMWSGNYRFGGKLICQCNGGTKSRIKKRYIQDRRGGCGRKIASVSGRTIVVTYFLSRLVLPICGRAKIFDGNDLNIRTLVVAKFSTAIIPCLILIMFQY